MNILSAKLPPDDVEARLMRFEGIRRQRNAEIFLIGGHAPTSPLVGGIYNTVGLNDPEEVGDTCPQEFLDRVDLEELKDDYEILGTFKIGPRLRCIDWLEVMVGAQRHLMGLDARWVMWLDVLEEMREHEEVAYKRIEGKRDTQMGMNAGEPAFILDGREGDSRVMKSAGLIIDPTQTYDRLKELGRRLQPAAGWSLRAVTPEEDLVLAPDNGRAVITQDELGNTYDRAGGPFSNYKP